VPQDAGQAVVGAEVAKVHALSTSARFPEALARVAAAIGQFPNAPELLLARASTLFDWGRLREARDGYLQAEAAGVRRPALYLNLAWTYLLLGSPPEAEAGIRKALVAEPGSLPARYCLARILQAAGRFAEAIDVYRDVLADQPDDPESVAGIAACQLQLRSYRDAEASARRATTIAPDRPGNWVNLAIALAQQDRLAEALDTFSRAHDIEVATGEDVESFVSFAHWLLWSGRPQRAIDLCRERLGAQPNPSGHAQYAFALLTAGHFREGWEQYEFRWFQEPLVSRRIETARPVWAEQDLAGKTLLLHAEQGAGDTMQFARFAASFKSMGATIVLQVQPEVRRLAEGFAHVDRVASATDATPAHDYHLPLMSAAHALKIQVASLPAHVPYLRARDDVLPQWAARIPSHPRRVGIAWAGNRNHDRDRHRSIPLDHLDSLWNGQDIRFVSLQKGLGQEASDQLRGKGVLDLGNELADFGETAAVVASLELVVCVDTAIAHLAGAMGKAVWLLLPEHADFRWLRERDDSPWYPTMCVVRQRHMGEWLDVIGRVKAALAHWAAGASLEDCSRLLARDAARPLTKEAPASSDAIVEPVAAHTLARVVETRHGIVQYVPEQDDVAYSVAFYGEYQQSHVDVLARLLPRDAVALETGSGIGIHALALARSVVPAGHLILYEDRPVMRRILRQNLDANRLGQLVTLMRRPLAEKWNHPSVRAVPKDAQDAVVDIPRESVDGLLLDRLDLLKVLQADANAVLAGASETLWRLRPVLFLAAANAIAVSSLAAQASRFGYRCWRMDAPLFPVANFNERDRDIFDGRTGFALLAIPEERDVNLSHTNCYEVETVERVPRTVASAGPGIAPDRSHAPAAGKSEPTLRDRLRKWFR
jgi:tetratricopeptide (TPR) repeat protein